VKTTLNLSFNIFRDDTTGFTYCTGLSATALASADSCFESSLYAGSINTAKAKLRPMLETEINDALTEHRNNYHRRVIACQDGTVLIVYFRYGNWCYDIAGESRSECCTNSGFKTFEEALERAVSHAGQSYGGVSWKC
jgi:hypothetical protein